jgi:hypothetical protein
MSLLLLRDKRELGERGAIPPSLVAGSGAGPRWPRGVGSGFSEREAMMYARVARWEGPRGCAAALRRGDQLARGIWAPPGVPAKGFLMLIDPGSGRSVAVALFETEADLQTGDQALDAMNPSGDDVGARTSVETYEVAVDVRI